MDSADTYMDSADTYIDNQGVLYSKVLHIGLPYSDRLVSHSWSNCRTCDEDFGSWEKGMQDDAEVVRIVGERWRLAHKIQDCSDSIGTVLKVC